jgi:hypothetical protein
VIDIYHAVVAVAYPELAEARARLLAHDGQNSDILA